jgi:hypothetical protein
MKKTLILALGILMCASLASAQYGGQVSLYSDVGYTDCNLVETVGGINVVYMVHDMALEATASQFSVAMNWPTATAFPPSYGTNLVIGSSPLTGIAVTYAGAPCRTLPWLIGTWQFFVAADTPPCTFALEVQPDPNAEDYGGTEILTVDCASNLLIGSGGKLTVDGDETCPCLIIANEETSWSQIKALYQ